MRYLVCVRADRYTKSSRQAKISQLDLSLSIDEEILRFQVSMKNPVRVAEGQALQQLEQITLKTQDIYKPAPQTCTYFIFINDKTLFALLVIVYLDKR